MADVSAKERLGYFSSVTRARRRRTARSAIAIVTVISVVLLLGWLALRPNWQPRSIVGVEGAVDSQILDVTVAHEDCGTGNPRVSARESGNDSVVLVAEYNERGDCNDIGLESTVTVELARELGDRTVSVTIGREIDCEIAGRGGEPCTVLNAVE